jgi:hypothetical protein
MAVVAILIVAALFQANRNACYWHGDPVAFADCLMR